MFAHCSVGLLAATVTLLPLTLCNGALSLSSSDPLALQQLLHLSSELRINEKDEKSFLNDSHYMRLFALFELAALRLVHFRWSVFKFDILFTRLTLKRISVAVVIRSATE